MAELRKERPHDGRGGDPRLAARRASDSQVTLSQQMMPSDANPLGNVHGGNIMKLVDEAGALAGQRVIVLGDDDLVSVALAAFARARSLPAELSYEAYMRCGIGLCGSCTHGPRLACLDGPVFDA